MKVNINNIEKFLKIKFKNKSLLENALTHKSANQKTNNEKLEFLGDRVIGLVMSKKLYDLYPNVAEDMTSFSCGISYSIKSYPVLH